MRVRLRYRAEIRNKFRPKARVRSTNPRLERNRDAKANCLPALRRLLQAAGWRNFRGACEDPATRFRTFFPAASGRTWDHQPLRGKQPRISGIDPESFWAAARHAVRWQHRPHRL